MKKVNGILLYPIAAFIIWGFLPLYWKALKQISSGEILAYRIIWSFVLASLVTIISGNFKGLLEVISNRKNLLGVSLAGLLVSLNWLIFIWAVNNDKVVEASLGLYINPIVVTIFGWAFLKERLDLWIYAALLLAFLGVSLLTIELGKFPWVSLFFAITWGLYALVKKLLNVDSVIGLTLETLVLTPVALGYLVIKQFDGTGSHGFAPFIWALLILSGVVTATPLYLFAQGVRVLPLSTIGFTQYISPSISLLLGVFLFKEPFTKVEFLSFGLIWCACALYTFSLISSSPLSTKEIHK